MKDTYVGLIYGQPGVGKTTLALSSVNPVCIDADRGMYRVEKRYQAPSLQVESYQQVLDLLNSKELEGFDTLGKLIDCMGEYITKHKPKYRQSNGQLTMQGWGQVKIEFRALVKLINSKTKSVLFVAHESEEKEGDITKKRPDVSGSARKDIVKELDFMGYMEMSGNKRTISFSPSSAYYAKNSMGLETVMEIPGIQAANNAIDTLINTAKDIPAINKAYASIAGLEHIGDSKLYAWSRITEAAAALNATWDRVANQFAGPVTPIQDPPADQREGLGL
jgi:hypothetical protein